jgi:monooxygenase
MADAQQSRPTGSTAELLDVVVVGAGLSGIGAACHLQTKCPSKTYAILEGRDAIGGTWDLFRYPGIRSDSDMFTLGYRFKPWTAQKSIADGPSILQYVRETAQEHHIEQHIRYRHRVVAADWDSSSATWQLTVQVGGTPDTEPDPALPTQLIRCRFLFMCSGYYRYSAGYTPEFPGIENFRGEVVHPQRWTKDIVHAGKKVVVIGSGATAVTLVPEMAKTAAHVTMLQRSPTYMVSRPSVDPIAQKFRKWFPPKLAYWLTRWKQVLLGLYVFRLCRNDPQKAKGLFLGGIRMNLGKRFSDADIQTHFTPSYNPWEQRLCLVPDADMFKALNAGQASVVTDHIERFDATGIQLKSGQHLDADMVVTATGLTLQFLGGMKVNVDGKPQDMHQTINYKGIMYSGLPNLASCFGYTNASWTLKADLSSEFVCRLINHMDKHGIAYCVPRNDDATVEERPWVDFSSGYFARAMHQFPKQGSKAPWRLYQHYPKDIWFLRHSTLDDGVLRFVRPDAATAAAA